MRTSLITLFFLSVILFSFGEAHAQEKDPVMLFFKNGEAFRMKKQYIEAIGEYEHALAIADTSAMIYYWKGMCHFMLKENDKAIADWEKTTQVDAYYTNAYTALIKAYKLNKDNEKVISTMDRMANVENDPVKKAKVKLDIAKFQFKANNNQEASKYVKEVIDISPNNFEALYLNGQISNQLTNYNDAIKSLEKAVALLQSSDPKVTAPVFYELGYAYHMDGHFNKSKQAFAKANFGPYRSMIAKLQPEYYYSIASVYSEIYDFETAYNMLNTALSMDKQYAQANILMAELNTKEEHHSKGIHYYKQALEDYNGNDKIYLKIYETLIDIQITSKKYNEAISTADDCLLNFPDARNAAFMKAIALFKSGNVQESVFQLEQLLKTPTITPIEKVQYNFALGTMYGISKPTKAKKAFMAARRGPFADAAQHAFEKIEEQTKENSRM